LSPTRAFIASVAVALLLIGSGCGHRSSLSGDWDELNTREIIFQADPYINEGQVVPIDVIYVSYLERLREITVMGAETWFNSSKRSTWKAKQSLLVKSGQVQVLQTNPRLRETSAYILILAEFKDVISPSAQQIIIDSQANRREIILVKPQSLEAVNPDLNELR
jgi:hypothetical protein